MKIGLAVITYNRLDYLKQCLKSIDENNCGGADSLIIIDDCSTDGTVEWLEKNGYHFIRKLKNVGVGDSKTCALEFFMDKDDKHEHIFIMEDDILMLHPKTCEYYIAYAKRYGLHHLNFALHGPLNKDKGRLNKDGVKIYPDCVGAFSYYSKECIERVGYMDTNFKNAWEHVEHTYRISQAGLTTPFWQFADCILNYKLLKEIPGSIDNSVIRPRDDWQKNVNEGQKYFLKKHGAVPRPKWLEIK